MTPATSAVGERSHGADAIVVAAGASARMGGIDKMLAPLGGRPLIVRTLEALAASPRVERIVLVMGSGPALETIRPQLPAVVAAIVPGGPHRGASVEAGLRALQDLDGGALDHDRIVLVHDGARPLVTTALIDDVVEAATTYGAAFPTLPVADTIRRVRADGTDDVVDRTDLVASQTPQGIRAGLLGRAFARFPSGGETRFTDEAALLMACTIRVHPILGDPVNLKVTLPADLAHAAAIVAAGERRRVGHGIDGHPFGPGSALRLAGITFDGAPSLHGHSDGDVVLHAVADALLGAAAMGDLGRLFPADGRTARGADSAVMLRAVVDRLHAAGWAVETADITVTAARPRLAGRLDEMGGSIASLLGVTPEAVSVKASTGNLDGASGAGRSIEAEALVSIVHRPGDGGSSPPRAVS